MSDGRGAGWALIVICACVMGCETRAGIEDAGPLRGPEGGVLRFDAAMLLDGGRDAGTPPDVPRTDTPRDVASPDVPMTRTCAGVPTSCYSLGSSARCATQMGCRRDGECSGVSRSCYSMYTSYSCSAQDGCYWTSSRNECSGSARSCILYSSSSACTGQDGCDWDDTCEGIATSCYDLSPSLCTLQEGCYLR